MMMDEDVFLIVVGGGQGGQQLQKMIPYFVVLFWFMDPPRKIVNYSVAFLGSRIESIALNRIIEQT